MLRGCFQESTLSPTLVFELHKAFSEGREVIGNLSHTSCPSTSVKDDNIETVKEIVFENRRVGSRKIAENVLLLLSERKEVCTSMFMFLFQGYLYIKYRITYV